MTHEDQVFVANVVVIDLTKETMVVSVIYKPTRATLELNAIVKICNYKGLHERHHFISMAMEVHDTHKRDMDHFIKKCVRFFHDR